MGSGDARRDGGPAATASSRGWRSDPFFFRTRGGALNDLQVHRRRFLHRQRRVQHRAGDAQLCPLDPNEVGLWARPRWTARAGFGSRADRGRVYPPQAVFLRRLRARWLPRGRAGERCPFSSPSSRMRWSTPVAMRRDEARRGGGNTAARHAVLRPRRVPRVFSEQWPVRSPTMPADAFLAVLTSGRVTEDKVGPHHRSAYRVPPIWGPPHNGC